MTAWRFDRLYYEEWKSRFLNQSIKKLKTNAICAACLKPLTPREIMFRALLRTENVLPKNSTDLDGVYIIYTYVCSHSVLTEGMIDDLILISSGRFDFDNWNWTDEAVQNAIQEIENGGESDKLDWKSINAYQRISDEYKEKRRYFFSGNLNMAWAPYVAKTMHKKEEEDEKRRAKKKAPWIHNQANS